MNLKVLKKSKGAPVAGDIFALQLKPLPNQFFFGRVVRTDAKIGGFNDTILIYIYRASSREKNKIPSLAPADLLVAPIATNPLPWKKGYFEVVAHRPLAAEDLLPRHVFRDTLRKRLFDDLGNEVTSFEGLIGIYGLHSYQTIDDEISKALGLP